MSDMRTRHDRKSIRLSGFNYARPGKYYITICTQNRHRLFGEIREGIMHLNEMGKIVQKCWTDIPNHYPQAILHENIIMPDHVHGIIEITDPMINERSQNLEPFDKSSSNKYQQIIPGSIGSIVRGFKIGVTKWSRQNTDIKIVWQRNYYERIIKSQQEYDRITEYIINNPKKWDSGRGSKF